MASTPPSTWVSAPTSLASPSSSVVPPSGAKIFSLPPKRFKSRGALSASCSKDGAFAGETEVPDHIRLAFSKAKAYKKDKMLTPTRAPVNVQKPSMEPTVEAQGTGSSDSEPEVPIAIKLAMEKAKENKKDKQASVEEPRNPGEEDESLRNSRNGWVESKLNKELKISSKDFLGLDFSEKKSYRGKPPGLVPLVGPLLEGDEPEVEIIVGDASKFEKSPQASTSLEAVDNSGLYKPKISTWGVFPRPNNISKTILEVEELLSLVKCLKLQRQKRRKKSVAES